MEAAERGELLGQRANARFEASGALACFGGAGGLFGEPLVRERQRDVLGDAASDQGVGMRVEPRRERHEVDAGDELTLDSDRQTQGRPQTALRRWQIALYLLRLEVVDDFVGLDGPEPFAKRRRQLD